MIEKKYKVLEPVLSGGKVFWPVSVKEEIYTEIPDVYFPYVDTFVMIDGKKFYQPVITNKIVEYFESQNEAKDYIVDIDNR